MIRTASMVLLMAAACGGVMALKPAIAAEERPPNFIIIFVDDQGYQDLGCYGAEKIKTPRIDRMAAEGIRFTDFYVAAPLCSPSRAALLTGCYPTRIGMGNWVLRPDSNRGIHPDEVTLAELLKTRGYTCGCIGKWHIGFREPFRPLKQGFDCYYGLLHNLDLEVEYLADEGGVPLLRGDEVVQRPAKPEELTERYTTEALEFITRNQDRPFFLYLPHTMAHHPLAVSEHFAGKSSAGLYGDVIECLDWSTGQILDGLEELDLVDNTYVVYTSDNGPTSIYAESPILRGRKLQTYEGGMRVPCVVWAPGRIPPRQVCSELVTAMDFYPTFARLAGAKLPGDRVIDGRDITRLLFGEAGARSPHDAFFYHGNFGELAAVRSGKWKLHFNPELVLYDLEADPGEQTPTNRGNNEVIGELRAKAIEFQEEMRRNGRPAGEFGATERREGLKP
jgi:arylsulfatase A-like enzyme